MSGPTLLITCLLTLVAFLTIDVATSAVALAGLPSVPTLQAQNPTDIAAIEAYSKQMDAYVKRNSRGGRFFGDMSNYDEPDAPARWQEFRNKRALRRAEVYSAATAWMNPAGVLLVADFSLTSPSGDWAQDNIYYYRSDGSLAKLHSEMRTFFGDVIIIRDRLYDSNGKLLQEKTKHLDLQTRKPKKVKEGEYADFPPEVYAKTSNLPFYALLKKRR